MVYIDALDITHIQLNGRQINSDIAIEHYSSRVEKKTRFAHWRGSSAYPELALQPCKPLNTMLA